MWMVEADAMVVVMPSDGGIRIGKRQGKAKGCM